MKTAKQRAQAQATLDALYRAVDDIRTEALALAEEMIAGLDEEVSDADRIEALARMIGRLAIAVQTIIGKPQ